MRIRPLAAVAAATLTLGVAGPAMASTTAQPAAGSAKSGLTLLSLALAGHDIRVGSVALVSDTVSGKPTSSVVVTPLRADGKGYGEQTVSGANSPASVPSFDSSSTLPAALNSVLSVKSPVFTVSASDGSAASSKAGAASLGSVSVLGIPVKLNGTIDASSLVDGTNALGEKTISVKNLALPSIADLLKALGLDLSKLPTKTLTDLLAGLNLTNTAVTTAQAALNTAQAALGTALTNAQGAVDTAQTQLADAKKQATAALSALDAAKLDNSQKQAAAAAAQTAVTQANTAVTDAQTQLNSVTSAISTATSGALAGSIVYNAYLAANPSVATALQSAQTAVGAATKQASDAASALASANTAAQAAAAALTAVQGALDTANNLVTTLTTTLQGLLNTLNGLLGQLTPQVNALLAAVTAVLNGTPLASIDSFTVQTQSMVTSAKAGGQVAKVVGGEVQGVHVLGTDVLSNVLGNSSINVVDLAGSTLSQVTAKIASLNGVLSSVLSAVPGLSIPAPTVGLLTKSTSTGIANGFGTAQDSVSALSVSIPAITLPAALALPNAASLPAITGVPNLKGALGIAAVGDLTSQAMTLSVGTLSEQASFRPAVAGSTPTTVPGTVGTPQLPRTGLPAGAAVLALLLVGTGLVLRRRMTSEV